MSGKIERRSTLTKAQVGEDVVAGLVTPAAPPPPAPVVTPAPLAANTEKTAPARAKRAPRAGASAPATEVPVRRGPGRPRGRRYNVPFSSTLEITLRDAVDAYIAEHGISMVELLDVALRREIASPPNWTD